MRSRTLALGLGSNLENPIENLRRALSEIKKNPHWKVLKVSSIYESEAQLPENASTNWNKSFLNAVVLCRVADSVSAEDILYSIKKIEAVMGRLQSEKWAPRLIDIDILYWDSTNYSSEKINIPHLKLFERPFALLPLLEIWPDLGANLPSWAQGFTSVKPFGTQKSKKYFWPRMVGILNITKDSFSDGGRFLDAESLHRQYDNLVQQGAEIIDIGGESTRPGAVGVSAQDEYESLNWALQELKPGLPVSLDCRKAAVVARVLATHSISYLNDVSGFTDGAMKTILKKSGLPAFVMHSLSVPPQADLIINPEHNPCQQLVDWWSARQLELNLAGISSDQMIFDPGIGFGKNKLQDMYILQHLEQFSSIRNKIMIGHSRKSFLSLVSDRMASERDLETALVTKDLNLAYVQYLRVHDVQTQVMALK